MALNRIKSIMFLLASLGCGPETTGDFPDFKECTLPETQQFSLGTGANEFVPISEDGSVQLVAGFQGGYHIHASVDLPDLASRRVRLLVNLCQNGTVIARGRDWVDDNGQRPGFQTSGLYVYVLHDYFPANIAQVESAMVALVITADGTEYRAGSKVSPACCVNLLNGEQPD